MNKDLDSLRSEFQRGMRVKLIHMDDMQAPVSGTLGTIRGVDDLGNILMAWDSGSTLSLIFGEDEFEIVSK